MVDILKHSLIKQSYEVSLAIEECGCGEKLTAALVKSSELTQAISDYVAQTQKERDEPGYDVSGFKRDPAQAVTDFCPVCFSPGPCQHRPSSGGGSIRGTMAAIVPSELAQARREGMEEAAAIALSYKGDLLAGPDGKILRLDKFPDEIAAAIRRAKDEHE